MHQGVLWRACSERRLSPDDRDLRIELRLPLSPFQNVHQLDGDAEDLSEECARYEAAIAAAGGVDLTFFSTGKRAPGRGAFWG